MFPINSTLFSKRFILLISRLKFLLKFYEKFIFKSTIVLMVLYEFFRSLEPRNSFMTRFENFSDKISHINWHEESDKVKTIESLRNLLIAENNNYLDTVESIPLSIKNQLNTDYYTRKYFIEKLIELIDTLPIREYPEEHIEDIIVSQD